MRTHTERGIDGSRDVSALGRVERAFMSPNIVGCQYFHNRLGIHIVDIVVEKLSQQCAILRDCCGCCHRWFHQRRTGAALAPFVEVQFRQPSTNHGTRHAVIIYFPNPHLIGKVGDQWHIGGDQAVTCFDGAPVGPGIVHSQFGECQSNCSVGKWLQCRGAHGKIFGSEFRTAIRQMIFRSYRSDNCFLCSIRTLRLGVFKQCFLSLFFLREWLVNVSIKTGRLGSTGRGGPGGGLHFETFLQCILPNIAIFLARRYMDQMTTLPQPDLVRASNIHEKRPQ
mmetsp:Transcript_13231/g.30111  ORF Transcript_13231/g.30111 Transcript_13231/m.30111 type:complete len:281 (-) Transcript_13231:505-1347(-)